MERREFLFTAAAPGIAAASGCLRSNNCDESSNHLYVENQRSDTQTVDIRVFKEGDGLLNDGEWTNVLLETIEIPGETYQVVESVYDAYGTYRTEAECQFDHTVRSDQQISAVDSCDGQVVTIGIGNNIVTILNGIPDHLSSENRSEPESDSVVH
ncbi:hypothetical protein [Natrinema salaciae]|uniref:Uncharacterized protein n=1 Tax=Natrinema salaciae TaxID=1186196 RepID=A0A1H9LNV4_9EURY|nr:hypothetical protein [Natrinema salaciae]SER12909.1 hypothetical protein SAMN04489841_3025 [Natrinema salaciae]